MDCYFGAVNRGTLPHALSQFAGISLTSESKGADARHSVLVTFVIPEVGIRFKAPFVGEDRYHSDLASLLALLEFIDTNQKYVQHAHYMLHGTNLALISQLNGEEPAAPEFEPLLARAKDYFKKYRISLNWVPASQNQAIKFPELG